MTGMSTIETERISFVLWRQSECDPYILLALTEKELWVYLVPFSGRWYAIKRMEELSRHLLDDGDVPFDWQLMWSNDLKYVNAKISEKGLEIMAEET